MQITQVTPFACIMEHDSMPFIVALNHPIPFPQNIKINENLVCQVKPGDLPFYVDNENMTHFVTKDSLFGNLIVQCMVHGARTGAFR